MTSVFPRRPVPPPPPTRPIARRVTGNVVPSRVAPRPLVSKPITLAPMITPTAPPPSTQPKPEVPIPSPTVVSSEPAITPSLEKIIPPTAAASMFDTKTIEAFIETELKKPADVQIADAVTSILPHTHEFAVASSAHTRTEKMVDDAVFRKPQHPKRDCDKHWVSKRPTHSDRVLSWCVVSTTGSCDGFLCYDVDEVQEWIQSQGFPREAVRIDESGNITSSKNEKCLMFMQPETQQKVNELTKSVGEIIIPQYMPDEFMQVFLNYDLTKAFTVAKLARDRVLNAVRLALESWLKRQADRADVALDRILGVFWTYTKKKVGGQVKTLFQKAWDWTWYLLHNPYWLIVIVAVSRLFRMALCIYIALPHLGKAVLIQILDSTLGDIKNAGLGIGYYLYSALLKMIDCFWPLLSGAYTGQIPHFNEMIASCGIGAAWTHATGIFTVTKEFFSTSAQTICDAIGLTGVADFVYVVARAPHLIVEKVTRWFLFFETGLSVPGAKGLQAESNLTGIFRRFNVLDWNMATVLLFLSYCPASWLHRLTLFVLGYTDPVLLIAYNLFVKKHGMHPILFVKYLAQNATTIGYAAQFINEIKQWVFDVLPCVFNYFIDYIKSWIGSYVMLGEEEKKEPNEAVACCMVKMVQEIQETFSSDEVVVEYKERMRLKLQRAKDYVWSYFQNPNADTAAKAQDAIDEVAAGAPLEEFSDKVTISAQPLLNLSNATPAALELPKQYESDLVPIGQSYWEQGKNFVANKTESITSAVSGWSKHLFGFASDGRDKHRLVSTPVCFVKVSAGVKLPMYLFTWKQDALVRDGLVHASIYAQDVEKVYPRAILTWNKRKFILRDRIPVKLSQTLVAFGNPVLNLSSFVYVVM